MSQNVWQIQRKSGYDSKTQAIQQNSGLTKIGYASEGQAKLEKIRLCQRKSGYVSESQAMSVKVRLSQRKSIYVRESQD